MSKDYLEQIRRETAHIRPHREHDDGWYDQGSALLRSGRFDKAERKFKELVASQPQHHGGYEGLALTYQRQGRRDEALFFMREAIKRARQFFDEGTLDPEALEELQEELHQIEEMEGSGSAP